LTKDFCKSRQTNSQLGLKRENDKSQIRCASQRPEIPECIREGRTTCTKSKTSPPRGPYISSKEEPIAESSEKSKPLSRLSEDNFQCNYSNPPNQDGIQAILAHHFFQRLDGNHAKFIGVIQTLF